MISFIGLLVLVERIVTWWDSWISVWKSRLRQTLGPEPATQLWIYEQGEVYPPQSQLKLPQWIYSASERTLTSSGNEEGTKTKKRLPWISLHYKHGDSAYDFSEWLSEVRMLGMRSGGDAPSIIQLLRLAAAVHNYPVLIDNQTRLTVMERSTGETITLVGPTLEPDVVQDATALPNTAQPILAPE